MAVAAAQIWCFPGIPALLALQDCKRSFQDNQRKQCKSGTAISPENESYFWSLYQTKQSLPASSRPAWKLLNTRDEDNRVFLPEPCSRMVLGGSPISRLCFSILLTSGQRPAHEIFNPPFRSSTRATAETNFC